MSLCVMCMYVFVCPLTCISAHLYGNLCACVYACLWRSKIGVWRLLCSLFAIEARFHPWTWNSLIWSSWSACSGHLLSCLLPQVLELQGGCLLPPAFVWVPGAWILVPVLLWQALEHLSHLPTTHIHLMSIITWISSQVIYSYARHGAPGSLLFKNNFLFCLENFNFYK